MATNPQFGLPPEYFVEYDQLKTELHIQLFDYHVALSIHSNNPAETEYTIRKARESIDQMIVADYHAGKLALNGGGASASPLLPPVRGFTATGVYIDEAKAFQDSLYKEEPKSFIRPNWIPDDYLKGSWGAPTKKKVPAPKKKNAIEELITTTNPDAITFDF